MATTATNYNSPYHSANYGRAIETRAANTAAWALQILLAIAFFSFGTMKLMGAPMATQMFESIGLGQWLRYVTGTVEVVSAVLLLTPRTAAVGAFFLTCTMVGALFAHAFIIGGDPIPAAAFLILSISLVVLRWNRARAMINQENVVNV